MGALLIMAVAVTGSGCTPSPDPRPLPPTATSTPLPVPTATTELSGTWRPDGVIETLASGLIAPWSVVPLDGGGALISQRGDGTVMHLTAGGALRVAGVVPGVVAGGEAGLHGLAVLADGDDRWLYAFLGASDDNRVVRMALTGSGDALGLGEAAPVITGIPRARNHNGGRIAFGPDGLLYVTTGDAGDPDAAQDPASLGGKILRLTPEGAAAPGNPFDSPVFSLGHRNVQGIAWTSDGTMWASEFGQNTWDELNLIVAGGNYGWPLHEGAAATSGYIDPVETWSTDEASPSGIAAVGETVFVAGLRGEVLRIVDATAGEVAESAPFLQREQGRLRDVVAASDGTLWVLTNNTDGRGTPRAGDDLLLRIPLRSFD